MKDSKKILVIRFSSIGDIVLTTPLLRALKNTSDLKAEVHFVTKKAYAGFMRHNPNVDLVHELNGSLFELAKRLRAERFDFVIDLHKNLRSNLIRLLLMRPSKAFNKLNIKKWLLTNLKINRLPDIHIVDRYLAAAKALGVSNDGKGLDFFLSEEDQVWPEWLPEEFKQGYVAIVIGGMHATKRMPNQKIIDICRALKKPVVLLGGPEDAKNGRIIEAAAGQQVIYACGKLTLNQSAWLVKEAKVVITNDTGLMHIAAAFQKPIISVWGNTVPEFGMYPYMPQRPENSIVIEKKGLPCRPCSKIGYKKCPKGHFDCMEKISHQEVANAALRFF